MTGSSWVISWLRNTERAAGQHAEAGPKRSFDIAGQNSEQSKQAFIKGNTRQKRGESVEATTRTAEGNRNRRNGAPTLRPFVE